MPLFTLSEGGGEVHFNLWLSRKQALVWVFSSSIRREEDRDACWLDSRLVEDIAGGV
jgi:hypothetical protein